MKFIINRKYFVNELKDVKKGSVKHSTPIMNNTVKIDVNLDNIVLTVYGENSELIKALKNVNIQNMGGVVAKLSELVKILPKLQGDNIEISTDDDNLVIKSGETVLSIHAFSISNAVDDPKEPKKGSVKVNAKDFKNNLKSNLKNVSQLESRPVLTGVDFDIKNNHMNMISTDSHRLADNKIDILNNKKRNHFNMIIPATELNTFSKLMNTKDPIYINYEPSENDVYTSRSELIQNHLKINIKNVEGKYPDVAQCFAPKYSLIFNINRLKLQKAVRQVSIIAHESRNNVIHLIIDKNNNMKLTAESPDIGNIKSKIKPCSKVIRQRADCGVGGNFDINGDFNIAFNPDYMKDALNGYTRIKTISLGFNSPLRPFTVAPVGDPTRKQLITPVRTF